MLDKNVHSTLISLLKTTGMTNFMISPNFSDVHQKGSKNTGIGPWPHYREQPQNLDRINIKNPESLRRTFENEGNKLCIGVTEKAKVLPPAFSSLMP